MSTTIANASPSFVEYHALQGSYGHVSYFVTKTNLRDVAENLTLAPSETLTFTERIQREINVKRVETEILPYLRQNDLRFFNALVCVLLPDSDHTGGFWNFEEYRDSEGQPLGGLGKLRITKQVGRVVLDGQHRFLALQKLWNQVRNEPESDDAKIEVALIFVVVGSLGQLDSKQKQLRTRTIQVARNLFAVLNKTARAVDKTTLLLIDDTDIANVMTRRLIEEEHIDDRFVKWTKAQNLQPADPFFSVIHVIRDGIEHYLRDHRELLEPDYGTEEERTRAMATLYSKTPNTEVPTKVALPLMFTSSAPFKKWSELLKQFKIRVARQPEETILGKDEKKKVAKSRNEELAFTVAGQKAFFRAVIDCFYAQPKQNKTAMNLAIARANSIFSKGLFGRHEIPKGNPFIGVLVDTKGRMFFSESAVDCGRQILGIAIGSKSNRDAVLAEYKALTNLAPTTVEQYWKSTANIRR